MYFNKDDLLNKWEKKNRPYKIKDCCKELQCVKDFSLFLSYTMFDTYAFFYVSFISSIYVFPIV